MTLQIACLSIVAFLIGWPASRKHRERRFYDRLAKRIETLERRTTAGHLPLVQRKDVGL